MKAYLSDVQFTPENGRFLLYDYAVCFGGKADYLIGGYGGCTRAASRRR
jgi:hypothetical protein